MMQSKSATVLLALVGLWIALMVWQWFTSGEPQRVPLTNVTGRKVAGKDTAIPSDWALKPFPSSPESPAMPRRNLFAPLSERQEQLMLAASKSQKRKDPAPPTMIERPPAPEATEAAAVNPPTPDPVASAPPPPSPQESAEMAERQQREQRIGKLREQASQYRLLGFAERDGVKQAFVGKGSDIYIVKPGDQLDGIFTVSIVEAAGVKIREPEYNLEHTIQMKKDG